MRSFAPGVLLLAAASAHPFQSTQTFQKFQKFPRFTNDTNGGCDSSKYVCDPTELCALPFNSDESSLESTWTKSGANDFLHDFLANKGGIDDWADRLFQTTIGNGKQGGSTYSCSSFPSPGLCAAPGHNLCVDYTPPQMFYIHISMSNFYNTFLRIHEALQDTMITELASGIKEVVEKFGPPEPKNLIPFLSGSFVGAAALTGPFWKIGSPLSAIVGMLSIINGATDPPTPGDFEHDLEKSLGTFYASFAKTLDTTVKTFFDGTFWKLDGYTGNGVDFIMDKFANGKMLNNKLVDQSVDSYLASTRLMISQGMIFQALKGQDFFIWKNPEIDQDRCSKISDAAWINDRCTRFAKRRTSKYESPKPLSDEQTEIITTKYGLNIATAIDNGLRCAENGGGEPQMTVPAFGSENTLPPCFVSMDVIEDAFEIPCDNIEIC